MSCNFRLELFPNNSSVVELRGLVQDVTKDVVLDAVVTCSIYDLDGNLVPGDTFPKSMINYGENNYYGTLEPTLELVNGEKYRLVVDAAAPAGQIGHWDEIVAARIRRDQ